MKKGDTAKIIQPVIKGEITSVKYDEDTGEKRLLLTWSDDAGEHSRWCAEAELELVSAEG
jgi:hypothetical protein